MFSPKVKEWEACELRYVAEGKLKRLSDEDLVELERLLIARLGNAPAAKPDASEGVDRDAVIGRIMVLKSELARKRAAEAAPEPEPEPAPTPEPAPEPPARQAHEEEPSVEEKAVLQALSEEAKHAPHEEHDAQKPANEEELDELKERMAALVQLTAAAKLQPLAPEPEPAQSRPATAATAVAMIAEAEAAKAAITATATATAAPPPDADECVVKSHALRFCSFNAMKLKLSHPCKAADESDDDEHTVGYKGSDKGEALTRKWMMLAAVMSSYDVIVMQEIPGKQKSCDTRMNRFHDMLSLASDESWTWQALHSRPSGKDGKTEGTGAEVHVAFFKSPIELRGFGTLMKAGAMALDYAPLQLHLYDPRFEQEADREFVLTSVHLPPKGRKQARDSQLGALLRNYAAADTSEYRLNLPFAPNKETKRSPTHVIAGDFNVFPGSVDDDGTEDYGMTAAGFVAKIPQNAATSAGGQHYDNFLVNKASDERLVIGGGILRLKPEATANSRQGEPGLSDHWPITLTVQEYAKVSHANAAKAEPKKQEEKEEEEEPVVRTIEGSYTIGKELESEPEPESIEPEPEPEPAPEPEPLIVIDSEAVEPALASVREEEDEEEVVQALPQGNRDYDNAGSVGSATSDSDVLTDAPPELPRLSDGEEPEPEPEEVAAAVSAVVKEAMEQVTQSVIEKAETAEAVAEAAANESKEEPNLIDL